MKKSLWMWFAMLVLLFAPVPAAGAGYPSVYFPNLWVVVPALFTWAVIMISLLIGGIDALPKQQ